MGKHPLATGLMSAGPTARLRNGVSAGPVDDEGQMRRQWRPVTNTKRNGSRSVAGFPCGRCVQESGRVLQPGLAGSCKVPDCGVPSRPM